MSGISKMAYGCVELDAGRSKADQEASASWEPFMAGYLSWHDSRDLSRCSEKEGYI